MLNVVVVRPFSVCHIRTLATRSTFPHVFIFSIYYIKLNIANKVLGFSVTYRVWSWTYSGHIQRSSYKALIWKHSL